MHYSTQSKLVFKAHKKMNVQIRYNGYFVRKYPFPAPGFEPTNFLPEHSSQGFTACHFALLVASTPRDLAELKNHHYHHQQHFPESACTSCRVGLLLLLWKSWATRTILISSFTLTNIIFMGTIAKGLILKQNRKMRYCDHWEHLHLWQRPYFLKVFCLATIFGPKDLFTIFGGTDQNSKMISKRGISWNFQRTVFRNSS